LRGRARKCSAENRAQHNHPQLNSRVQAQPSPMKIYFFRRAI
jgi:hypothetical protein